MGGCIYKHCSGILMPLSKALNKTVIASIIILRISLGNLPQEDHIALKMLQHFKKAK